MSRSADRSGLNTYTRAVPGTKSALWMLGNYPLRFLNFVLDPIHFNCVLCQGPWDDLCQRRRYKIANLASAKQSSCTSHSPTRIPFAINIQQVNRKMSVATKRTDSRSYRTKVGWVLTSLACLMGCSLASNEYVEPPPPEVTYANPIEAPITPFVDENGVTEAANEAEVQSRVRGFLKTIEFQPGQSVKQGDILYTIERDQYEAAVESATADVETAAAAIEVAQASVKIADAAVLKATQDLDREERLKAQQASSETLYDAAVAASAAAKASLESARASVTAARSQKLQADADLKQAKIDLDFTEVRAEIEGRITRSNVKVGNLVDNGSRLATIVDDRQIFANFSVSDRAVLRLINARKAATSGAQEVGRESWQGTPVYLAPRATGATLLKANWTTLTLPAWKSQPEPLVYVVSSIILTTNCYRGCLFRCACRLPTRSARC